VRGSSKPKPCVAVAVAAAVAVWLWLCGRGCSCVWYVLAYLVVDETPGCPQEYTQHLDRLLAPLPPAVAGQLVLFARHLSSLQYDSTPDYELLSFCLSDAADACPAPSDSPVRAALCVAVGVALAVAMCVYGCVWVCGGVAVCGCVRVCGCVMLYCVWRRCVVVRHLAITLTASAPPHTHQPHSPQDSNQPPSIARTQSNASGSTLPSIDPVPDMSVGRGWARFDLRAEVLGEADTLRSRAALRTRTLERMRAVLLRRPRRQLLSAPVAADSVCGGAGVDAGAGVGAGVGVGAGIDEDGAAFSSDDSSMSEVSHASSLASRSSAEEDGPSKAKRQLRRVAFSVREPLTDLMIAERWAKLAVECVRGGLRAWVGLSPHVLRGVWRWRVALTCGRVAGVYCWQGDEGSHSRLPGWRH